MDIRDMKAVARQMAIGEAKARRAKKDMVEAELALGDFYRQKIHQPWLTIP